LIRVYSADRAIPAASYDHEHSAGLDCPISVDSGPDDLLVNQRECQSADAELGLARLVAVADKDVTAHTKRN
jgi:hypothetical protein